EGTYFENIDFIGKAITVASNYIFSYNIEEIENTVIDGGSSNTVVKFISNEDSTALLIGFSIINGSGVMGGGIFCNNSSPKIQYNIIRNNNAYHGGGIMINNSTPRILNNTIVNNTGYGIKIGNSTLELSNSISFYNEPDQINLTSGELFLTYSAIQGGWEGIGNIADDPLFENIENFEFQLQQDSPCKNTGNPHSTCDPDGTRPDMGALYFTNSDSELFADILVDVNTGYCPLEVHFQDYSEAFNTEITSWFWQFGDDSISFEINPIHTYSNLGIYTVSLIVSDEVSNSDSIVLDDFITVLPAEYNGDTLYISLEGSDIVGNGSEEYPYATIQHAIDHSEDNNTLIVSPGTYYENIDFIGKAITVASNFLIDGDTLHIENTIINGSQAIDPNYGSVVTFTSNEDTTSVIIGFTLTEGSGTYVATWGSNYGGGIICLNSSPKIISNIVTDNHSGGSGGMECSLNSSPIIMDNVISNNSSTPYDCGGIVLWDNGNAYMEGNIICNNTSNRHSGGMLIGNSTPTLVGNIITGNYCSMSTGGIHTQNNSSLVLINNIISDNFALQGGGLTICAGSTAEIQNCLIIENNAGGHTAGIFLQDSEVDITNCTISNNNTGNGAGGILLWDNNDLTITNCIVTGNDGVGIRFLGSYDVQIEFCNFYGNLIDFNGNVPAGLGVISGVNFYGTSCDDFYNIFEDPLFAGTGDDPFSLLEDSPCIDAGTPITEGLDLPPWDIIGNVRIWDGRGDGLAFIDMGAYEYGAPPVDADDSQLPIVDFQLYNYPNPFNPSTTISFNISNEQNEQIELVVYNLKGQKVKQLVSDQLSAGQHSVVWDGRDDNSKPVSSGIYFYKLRAGAFQKVKKMILL
ncbi:MAG: right-handed parallel beta-helix repeat-containing protein, partial [Candidatus Cloacimonetes bacterium]|nr:right-handed parallel beta-helix repeat-containing protein [Candidatus Cloacimonadota bacterium]